MLGRGARVATFARLHFLAFSEGSHIYICCGIVPKPCLPQSQVAEESISKNPEMFNRFLLLFGYPQYAWKSSFDA